MCIRDSIQEVGSCPSGTNSHTRCCFFMRDIERSTQSKYFVFCTGCTEGRKEDISQGRKNRTGWGHCRIRIIYPCVSLWQAYLCVYFSHFLFKSAPFVIVKIRPSVIGAMAAQVWAMWLIALAGFLSCHTVACLQKGKVSRFFWMQSMCVLRTHFINCLLYTSPSPRDA